MIKRKSKSAQEVLDRLNSFLTASEPEVVFWLTRFWNEHQQSVTYKELREAILSGGLDENTLAAWQQDYARFVNERLTPLWTAAMKEGANTVTEKRPEFVFNHMAEEVQKWIQTRGAEWVTVISEETRSALSSMIGQAASGAWTVDELARAIRPAVGLYRGQAIANLNYYRHVRDSLLEDNPKMRSETAEQRAHEAALKYAEKQQRYRAQMIANTEMAFAYNKGADESVKQAIAQGLMGKTVRVWSTAANEAVCPICRALDGVRIDMEDEFNFSGRNLFPGNKQTPPAHPNCQCAVKYVEVEPPLHPSSERGKIEVEPNDFFSPAKSIREANKFAETVLGIHAQYKGVALECANEWNKGLLEMKKAYPELFREKIRFVGEAHERNRLVKEKVYQQRYISLVKKGFTSVTADNNAKRYAELYILRFLGIRKNSMASSWTTTGNNAEFSGICMNEDYFGDFTRVQLSGKYQVEMRWHPVGCETVKSVFDHEFGHQLDNWLKVREQANIQNLFDSRTHEQITKELSEYAWNNSNDNPYAEMIAEGWAEYCNNPVPRPMALEIGRTIERLWAEWIKKNL